MKFRTKEELSAQLAEMRSRDIKDIDPGDVCELSTIKISKKQPPEKRVMTYLKQVPNPYVHKVGDIVVKASFSERGHTLQSCMEEYLKSEILLSD